MGEVREFTKEELKEVVTVTMAEGAKIATDQVITNTKKFMEIIHTSTITLEQLTTIVGIVMSSFPTVDEVLGRKEE